MEDDKVVDDTLNPAKWETESVVKLITDEPEKESITVEQQMQLLCNLFGHEDSIIWDNFTPDQREALKNKLKLILDPSSTSARRKNLDKYISDISETIWNQAKYTDGLLNMGIIFVALLNEKVLDVRNSKSYTLRPVFRTMKCFNKTNKTSCGHCMIFIDETGRVYQSWKHFMLENVYNPCVIVAPSKGVFNMDRDGKVKLEFFTAPSSTVGAKLLTITDKTATVTGISASACVIGGMATVALLPVAAPIVGLVMAGAGLVGAVSAGYSMVRSTQKIKDLNEHEKSLKLTSVEARGHWINLVGGMTGFISGVASNSIDLLSRSGHHISDIFRGSVNAINAASIAVNGLGVINGFSSIMLRWNEEQISTLEIMQLSASLFMFTHSVYNFETANSIIKTHHSMTINEFRDKLTQNQKHHFSKMSTESLKIHGKHHQDVIRSLRSIPDQKEFHKVHKPDNPVTEAISTAATILVAKLCEDYFVLDANDLKNTIINAMTLLSEKAFKLFLYLVCKFVDKKGEQIQKSFKGMVSMEEFMSDILKTITSISESLGLDPSEFIENLAKTEDFLASLIERMYDLYKEFERKEPNNECPVCGGCFSIKINSGSS